MPSSTSAPPSSTSAFKASIVVSSKASTNPGHKNTRRVSERLAEQHHQDDNELVDVEHAYDSVLLREDCTNPTEEQERDAVRFLLNKHRELAKTAADPTGHVYQ